MKELGKDDEDDRADDGAEHVPEATEEDDEEKQDRRLHREAVGADEAGQDGVETPAGAREGGAEGERDGAHPVRIQAERLGRDVALAHGDERAAPRRALEIAREHQTHEHGREHDVVVAAEAKRQRAQARLRDVGDAAEALGERAPLDQAVLDDDPEGDRHHREVWPAHTQGGEAEHHADDGAHQRGDGQRGPEPEAEAGGEDRGRVGAERVEPRLPQRDLPRRAGEDVETRRHHDRDADQHRDEEVVGVRRHERDGRGHGDDERAGDRAHARPAAPPADRKDPRGAREARARRGRSRGSRARRCRDTRRRSPRRRRRGCPRRRCRAGSRSRR